jgi:hypothetical protein
VTPPPQAAITFTPWSAGRLWLAVDDPRGVRVSGAHRVRDDRRRHRALDRVGARAARRERALRDARELHAEEARVVADEHARMCAALVGGPARYRARERAQSRRGDLVAQRAAPAARAEPDRARGRHGGVQPPPSLSLSRFATSGGTKSSIAEPKRTSSFSRDELT